MPTTDTNESVFTLTMRDQANEQTCQLQEMMNRLSGEIAASLAKQTDDLISAEITKRLGHSNWTPAELLPRLQALSYAPEIISGTLILLDRMPLIALWPPQLDGMPVEDGSLWQWHMGGPQPELPNQIRYTIPYKTFSEK